MVQFDASYGWADLKPTVTKTIFYPSTTREHNCGLEGARGRRVGFLMTTIDTRSKYLRVTHAPLDYPQLQFPHRYLTQLCLD